MADDLEKLKLNIRNADSEDLLDRVTVYRAGMETEALELIERELHGRGISAAKIAEHAETCQKECLFEADGTAKMCSTCRRPAVEEGWGWHWILNKIPLFPRWLRHCKQHRPRPSQKESLPDEKLN